MPELYYNGCGGGDLPGASQAPVDAPKQECQEAGGEQAHGFVLSGPPVYHHVL